MKRTKNVFDSSNGISKVSYYIYYPQEPVYLGIIQISHGMCDYMARYTTFCEYLCSLGYIVCGNDHIGHGGSVANEEYLGFFAHKNGWTCLIDDMKILTDIVRKRHPNLPYIVLGHSMGSLITRLYLARYGREIDAAILSGTIGPNPIASSGVALANSISHSRGETYRSPILQQMAFRNYNSRITAPESDHSWISRDKDIVGIYDKDDKCNFIFTASGYRDLFTMVQRANHNRCFRATPHDLPILVISGDSDPCGAYGDGVKRVCRLYQAVGVKQVQLILYKGARHEVLNETNRLEVFGDISRWLEQHIVPKIDYLRACGISPGGDCADQAEAEL